ncbi:hypothetical protein GC170_05335 [bacterium]|nr:hypothetical protein [bacterium]
MSRHSNDDKQINSENTDITGKIAMLHPIILTLIRFASVGTILLVVLLFFDQRETGQEIDLESGRTRTFVKYPGVPGKYGQAQDNVFSNFVRNRLSVAPVAPRWRKTASSGFGMILVGPTRCYNHGLTERSIAVFMYSIEKAPIDDERRNKLVSEMLTRLRSDDPVSIHEFSERCMNEFIVLEELKTSGKKPDHTVR